MYIGNPLSIPKTGFVFFLISILLFPVDSFPVFPIDTVHRPISILFLTVPLSFYVLKGRLHRISVLIFMVSILIFFHAVIATELLGWQNTHLKKAAITLILFNILMCSLFTIISDGLKRRELFFSEVGRVAFLSLVLMVLVALVQIFMKAGFIPVSLSDGVTHLFSYRSSQRVQSVTGEPAQMVRSVILLMILVHQLYFKFCRNVILFFGFLVLILSGSTYGYLTIVLMAISFIVLFKPSSFFSYKAVSLFLLVGVFFSFREGMLDSYTNSKIDAVWRVVSSLDIDVATSVLQVDGSIFQRAMNPIIGFVSGSYSNFLGVGLDGYRYIYPEIINDCFPYATKFSTVGSTVLGESYITPKSLYSKVFSELGLLPFFMMVIYYIKVFMKIKKKFTHVGLPHFLFIYILIVPISTGSIIYWNYFFSIAFLHLLVFRKQKYCKGEPKVYE